MVTTEVTGSRSCEFSPVVDRVADEVSVLGVFLERSDLFSEYVQHGMAIWPFLSYFY